MRTLRILHLEDDPLDAELVLAHLEEGLSCEVIRVDARQEFAKALEQECFDLILADYSLPSFDGISALEAVKARKLDVPFIFVSGALGEDVAVDTFKRGATDYVLKQRLERLVPAVERAIREAEERLERRRAEEALRIQAARHAALIATQQEIAKAEADLSAVLAIVVRRAQEIMHAAGAAVEFIEGEEIVYRAASGTAEPHIGLRMPINRSLSGQCVRESRVLICEDTETDIRADQEACRDIGVRSMIVVPLQRNRETIGVLKVLAPVPHAFDQQDTLVLQLMVSMIVAALSGVAEFEAKKALFISEERLRFAIENANVGTWHWDIVADRLIWSDHSKVVYGIAPEEPMHYRRFLEMLHPDDRERIYQATMLSLEQRSEYDIEYRIVWPDGSIHWIAAKGRGSYNSDGQPIRMEGIVLDITERKQAQEEIITLNRRLHRTVYESSHRIKNHLQVLSAMVDMQIIQERETVPIEEMRRVSGQIRALSAIHDLLTLQIKADSEAYNVSAKALLDKVLAQLQEAAGDRKLLFQIEDVWLPIKESTSLALVTNELISNAIKHGRRDIHITFKIENRNSIENGTGRLEVCDDGPGFPEGFDPITAANTGLELVENMGRYDLKGQIEFTNRTEGGARVTVTFPLPSLDALVLTNSN